MTLTPEQQRAVDSRGGAVLVSAAAGSGKTRVLVERLLDRVFHAEHPRDVDEFLLITFTRAAAAEMRERLSAGLYERLQADPGNAHLRRQTTRIYGAEIGTLDAYCQKLVKRYAPLCGVHPDTRVVADAERDALLDAVLDDTLERLYAEEGPDSPFFALTESLTTARGDRPVADEVLKLWNAAQSHAEPLRWLDEQVAAFAADDAGDSVWGGLILRYAKLQARHALERLEEALELIEVYRPMLEGGIRDAMALLGAMDEGWDAAAETLAAIQFPRLAGYRGPDKERAAYAKAAYAHWKDTAKHLAEYVEGDSELLRAELDAARPILEGLALAVRRFDEALWEEKRRLRVLEYMDYEHLAAELLGSENLAAEEAARFREIFVDEYQDISPLQEQIIQALSQAGRNLFLVGDVRQSIYRFRLADPGLFLRKYRTWPDDGGEPSEAPRRVLLTRNFRSAPAVLDAVNRVFAGLMSREAGELDYGPAEYLRPGQEDGGAPGAVEYRAIVGSAEDEADAVAARLKALLDEGYKPGDMAVLLRSPRGRLKAYQAAFARAGLPLRCPDGGAEGFYTAPEVQTVVSLLELLDNPRQDVPLLAALRCPAYGLGDGELAALRQSRPEGTFAECVLQAAEDGDETCGRLRDDLTALRELLPDRDAAQTLDALYRRLRLPRRERLRQLLLLAMDCPTVPEFLEKLKRLREGGRAADTAPTAGDAVQLLSVHQSKGLEYPVVVVADLGKRFNREDERGFLLTHPRYGLGPRLQSWETYTKTDTLAHRAIALQLRQENLAEEMRILYVAMTRAQERLILSCRRAAPPEGAADARPLAPAAVLRAGNAAEWVRQWTIDNGQLTIRNGGEAPAGDGKAEGLGNSRPDCQLSIVHCQLEADFPQESRWVYPYESVAGLPSKLTVTGLNPVRRYEPRSLPPDVNERGLSASDRGNAYHLAMQHVELSLCGTEDGVSAELQRLVAARLMTPEQRDAVTPGHIVRLLGGAWGRRMLNAPKLWREFRFSLLWDIEELTGQPGLGEQTLFQGVIDCFWEEDGGLVLLDYKTDRVAPGGEAERAERYRRQLDLYAQALTRIWGKPVTERAVYFFETGEAAGTDNR